MQKNILYIGPYREFSSMGNSARQYIKSLLKTNYSLSLCPIYNLLKPYPENGLDKEILDSEKTYKKSYSTIIQHCYPHQICYDNRFSKHIFITQLESSNCPPVFSEYLNIADCVVVGSFFSKDQISIDRDKIKIIPEPIDIDQINKYKQSHKQQPKKSFTFYCIADFVNKKNLDQILFAYFHLNQKYDNIELLIKTKSNKSSQEDFNSIIEYEISKQYNLAPGAKKKPKIISGEISQEEIWYIHNNNDCLITINSAESSGYSALEAIAFDNSVICLVDSPSYNITRHFGVDYSIERCMDDDKPYNLYNTFYQMWKKPKIESLIDKMELVINENLDQKQDRIQSYASIIKQSSIDSVSSLFLGII